MPNFWKPQRRRTPPTAGSAALDIADELHPVMLYVPGGVLIGQVAPNGERLLDIVNRQPSLRVKDADFVPYYTDLDATRAPEWTSVNRSDVRLVAPPDHQSPRQLRVHRRQRRVELEVPPFRVVGNAHMPPGFELNDFLRRQHEAFIPVTMALLQHRDNPSFDRSVPVVLVNVAHARGVRDLLY